MVFFCKCLIKPWCRVVGVRRTLLAGYATQAALYILAWVAESLRSVLRTPTRRHRGLIRHLQKYHEAEKKLVLAESNTSAQGKSQHEEALVEASSYPKKTAVVPHCCSYLLPGIHGVSARENRALQRENALLLFSVQVVHGPARVSAHESPWPPNGQGVRRRSVCRTGNEVLPQR